MRENTIKNTPVLRQKALIQYFEESDIEIEADTEYIEISLTNIKNHNAELHQYIIKYTLSANKSIEGAVNRIQEYKFGKVEYVELGNPDLYSREREDPDYETTDVTVSYTNPPEEIAIPIGGYKSEHADKQSKLRALYEQSAMSAQSM